MNDERIKAIQDLRPGCSFSLSLDAKEFIWLDEKTDPPSEDEILKQMEINKNKSITYQIPTALIVDRLVEKDLFNKADAALKLNPLQYAKFYTRQYIHSDNQEARDFLTAIGADPDQILAPKE